jgi:nucleotide-binding universal stress UspA family protein
MSTPVIMAPLDGSPAAEAALPWAVHLARRSNGAVRLVGVHAPPAVVLDGETLIGSVVPDASIRQRETDYFAQVQDRLKPTGVSVAADLLDGSVITSLAEYARELKPAWIVMLSHARGRLARFFLGETAAEFVRESPSPVLLVHPVDAPVDVASPPDVRHVLVPLDGSELAEKMLEPATEFAKALGVDVTLLMALAAVPDMEAISARHEPGMPGTWDPSAAPAKAQLYLEHKADSIRAKSMKVHCRIAAQGSAADVLVADAKAHPGTVIALATHGRGGLAKLVWGSVADEVVRRTSSPVLVLKPSPN